MNSVNTLYLIFGKVNLCFEEINGNRYLALLPTNESKEIIKKYEEFWSEIRDYDEKCMKIKFDSDDELPLNKTIYQYKTFIAVKFITRR